MLTAVRDALQWLRYEPLQRMNAGMVIEDVVNENELPERFANSPWLPQTYGCADYIIQEVWRIEAGWWENYYRAVAAGHPAR